jgi:hypothetical protein
MAFNSLQVELLTASTSDQDLCMTNVVFCINPAAPESLCVWSPSQQLKWLGFRWDLKQCLLSVPDRKLSDLHELIILALGNSTAVKVRTLTEKSRKIQSVYYTPPDLLLHQNRHPSILNHLNTVSVPMSY